MTAWRRFLFHVSGRLPLRVVTAGPENRSRNVPDLPETPLFERYKLLRVRGVTVFLHHYLRSDPDPAPHNHPFRWAWVMPLAGGYWERRPAGFDSDGVILTDRWRRPFVPYLLRDSTFHRVICKPGVTNWSLFIHGPLTDGWGFLRTLDPRRPAAVKRAPNPALVTPKPVYFEPTIDRTSSAALGRDWAELARRGREMERAEP